MFTTSSDLLNLSISIAVIAVAFFLCWTLYYLASNLRRINKISKQIESITTKSSNLLDLIKSKIKQSGSYMFLLGKLIDKGIDYFNKKGEAEKKNTKTKK